MKVGHDFKKRTLDLNFGTWFLPCNDVKVAAPQREESDDLSAFIFVGGSVSFFTSFSWSKANAEISGLPFEVEQEREQDY